MVTKSNQHKKYKLAKKDIGKYAITAASIIGGSNVLNAAIISDTSLNIVLNSGTTTLNFTDQNGSVAATFNFVSFPDSYGYYDYSTLHTSTTVRFRNDSFGTAFKLSLNDYIGSSNSWTSGPTEHQLLNGLYMGYSVGNFNGSSGYLGIRFVSGVNNYYGWIQYTGEDNTWGGTITGWGYNDVADTSILAGEVAATVNTPEPTALSILAAGALSGATLLIVKQWPRKK